MKEKINGVPRSRLPEYRIWLGIKKRCENPRSHVFFRYGARGIFLCERWKDFATFYTDMGPRPTSRHTIERLENDGPYSKTNCCWATKTVQANNRQNTRFLTQGDITLPLTLWARRLGITPGTLAGRIRHMPLEKALYGDVYRPQTTYLTYQGETHSVSEWAVLRHITPVTLRARLQRGYSIEEALNNPLQRGKRHDLRKE